MAPLWRKCVAEMVGTGFIVLFGTGSVACQVAFGAHQGLFQIAMIWGLGVSLAIFSTAAVSGAHLNPAVSLTLCMLRRDKFPLRELVPYVLAQLLGGVLGSGLVFASLGGPLVWSGSRNGVQPGDPLSLGQASAFGEYFPNPGAGVPEELVQADGAFLIEALGTGILMFMIFAITDDKNPARPPPGMAPFFIGMTVTVLISLFAPMTQAGWNPARDFGPRIVALLAGYGNLAIPGPRGGFWIYILGPCIGAPIGGLTYDILIAPGLPDADQPPKVEPSGKDNACVGMWCADQAVFQNLVREACASSGYTACGTSQSNTPAVVLGAT